MQPSAQFLSPVTADDPDAEAVAGTSGGLGVTTIILLVVGLIVVTVIVIGAAFYACRKSNVDYTYYQSYKQTAQNESKRSYHSDANTDGRTGDNTGGQTGGLTGGQTGGYSGYSEGYSSKVPRRQSNQSDLSENSVYLETQAYQGDAQLPEFNARASSPFDNPADVDGAASTQPQAKNDSKPLSPPDELNPMSPQPQANNDSKPLSPSNEPNPM